MGNNRITWNVGFNVDKSQLKEVNKELQALQKLTTGQLIELNPKLNLQEAERELKNIKNSATQLEQAFGKAFNPQLGSLNLKTLNAELNGMKASLPSINKHLSNAGIVGTQAFQKMASSIMGTKLQLKESNKLLDDMSKTMGNTIKWGITSRIFNGITESVQDAWDYTRRLDASLNDIRIVTGKSADEMERFARTANRAAQTLGKSTKDYTDAALIYYQQGLGEQEANKRAEVTLKTASVTGQSTDTVSEQLTAVWNGYKVATQDAEKYVDKLAAVAATTAADLEELSVGMSKVASAANIMGVDVDQLSATLSTVISVTRQAPETVGTAFKTIFARMGDIEAGLDGEVSLDKYTQDMLDVGGISVLDANNKLRDMGDVLEEVGNKWSTMTREQQIALSQVMAGTRQYNNLLSLFDNWNMYSDALKTSRNSLGTLQEQQDIYMESTSAHLHQLEAAWERVFDSFVDNEGVNNLIDVFTTLTNLLGNFTESLGGGGNALLTFGNIASRMMTKTMAQGATTFIKNQGAEKNNQAEVQRRIDALNLLQQRPDGREKGDAGTKERIKELEKLRDNIKGLNVDQIETFTQMIENLGTATAKAEMLNQEIEQASGFIRDVHNPVTDDFITNTSIDKYLDNKTTEEDRRIIDNLLYGQKLDNKNQKEALRTIDAKEKDFSKNNRKNSEADTKKLFDYYEKMYSSGETMHMSSQLRSKFEENRKLKDDQIDDIRERFYAAQLKETEELRKKAKTKKEKKAIQDPTQIDGNNLSDFYEQLNSEFKAEFEQALLRIVRDGKNIVEDAVQENSRQLEKIDEIKNSGGKKYLKKKAKIDKDNAKEDLDNKWKDIDLQKTAEQTIELVNGIGSLTSAIMTFKNIGSIWSDENLTSGEKMLQTVMAFTTALPMLGMGIVSIGKGLGGISVAFGFITQEELKAAIAAKQWGVAVKAGASAAGVMLAWAAVIAGIIAAIGLLINQCVKSYDATKIMAEGAANQVSQITEAYQECTTAVEELKKSTSDYHNAISAMENLTRGTDEYKKALEEANEQAQELINKYDLVMGKDYTVDEDGAIKIKTGEGTSLYNKQTELQNQANYLQTQQQAASMRASSLRQDQSLLEFQRATGVDYLSSQELIYTAINIATRFIPVIGDLVSLGTVLGRATSEHRGWDVSDEEAEELTDELLKAEEGYSNILGKSEEEVEQWILNNDKLSKAVKDNAKEIAKEKDELRKLTEATEEYRKLVEAQNLEMTRGNIQNNKELNDKIAAMSTDKDGNINEGTKALIEQALANSVSGQAMATSRQADLNIAKAYANTVKSNNDLEEFAKKQGLDTAEFSDLNDKKSAELYLKYVMGYSDEDISHINIQDQNGKTTATWDADYTDSKGTTHKGSDTVYENLDDEEGRQATAYAAKVAKITKHYDEAAKIFLDDNATYIQDMMTSTQAMSSTYGIDFSNVILNSMAARKDGKNGALDFSNMFDTLTDAQIDELIAMDTDELAKALGMTEEDFTNLGYDSAAAFEKAFDSGLFENERKALLQLMNDINAFGANGSKLTDEQRNNLATATSENLTTTQMKNLSKSPLSLSQIDFSNGDLNKTTEQLQFMADCIDNAMNGTISLTSAQKEEAEELEYSEDALKAYAEELQNTHEALEDNDKAAVDIALANVRMNKGIETLADNWEHWSEVLKEGNKNSGEYYEVLSQLKNAMSDMFGVDVSNAFATNEENLAKMGEIAKGNTESFDELRDAAALDYVANLAVVGPDQAAVDAIRGQLTGMVEDIQSCGEIEIGTKLDTGYIDQMNEMLRQGQITEEQMNKIFSAIGYSPTVSYIYQDGPETVTTHEVSAKLGEMEIPIGTVVDRSRSKVAVPQIDGGSGTNGAKAPQYIGKPSGKNIDYSNGAGRKKGSGKDADKMDKVDDEADRYHKVNTQLTKIDNNLSKIQSQEKKLTGAKLIANINAQLGQLNKRLDQLREKMKIAQGETAELRNSLAGQGVEFNPDGTISNYMEIYQAKVDYVNSLIDKYNAMSADEQEKYKETVEQAKQDLEKFTEDLDRYDELVSDFMPGLEQEIQDAIDEQIELNIKKFNIEFEVRLDMEEAEKEWNEFKKKIIDGIKDDDIYGNAKARATDDLSVYLRENGGALDNSTKRTNEILAELREMDATGWSDVYGDNRAQALEDLKEAYSAIMEDLMEIDEIQKDVHQAWLDTMDDINDKMADQVAMYEQISNIIEHDMKVIQLVYGEQDYEALGKYYDKQHQNNLGLLEAQRMNADFWEKEMNSIDKEKDPDAWKKARDNWISAVNDLNATIEASIENARAKMENAIDETFDKLNDEITNGKGLDYLQQQWDLVNDNANDYLDTVNAAFGIRQLENKYQDAIDMTDNVSAQRKLNQLMQDELKALREKDKLTEYDIERANMKYEIAMKQLALEEAQQTKTTMRLRRDSQGNYRYEYVADEDAIGKLQEELDQLENSLYNFDKDRWLEMQNQVVDAVRERQEAIKEILMDASLSEEERAERLAEINALYNEKIQNITDQTVTAQENLYQSGADEIAKIWDEQGKDFKALSDEEQRILIEEMLPQFDTGVNQMIEKFSGEGGFEEQTTGSMEELSKATQDYKTDLEDIETASGTSFDAIEDGLDKNIPKTQQLVQDNQDLNDEYVDQIENIKELNRQLDIQIAKYKALKTSANEAAEAGHNYYMQQKQQEADAAAAEKGGNGTDAGNSNNNMNGNGNSGTGSGSSGSGDGNPRVGDAVTLKAGHIYHNDSWGNGPTGSLFAGVSGGVKIDSKSSTQYGGNANRTGEYDVHIKSANGTYGDLGWVKLEDIEGYDTGGYTGDWVGNYGKLALLHNKELVLNENDTKNMLSMMEIARSIVANAGPGIRAFNAGRIGNSAPDQLEQNVHIEANFPNVEKASEIEDALNNLVQLASQRASRNRRG